MKKHMIKFQVKEKIMLIRKISGSHGGEYEDDSFLTLCSLKEIHGRFRGTY
jgi:hypothetical protein